MPISPMKDVTVHDRWVGSTARFGSLIRNAIQQRHLLWLVVHRDFTVRYRQSLLGYLWALVFPVLALVMFFVISRYRILPMGQLKIPYIIFGIWSISVWQLFAGCINNCTNSLAQAGTLVTKMNFSKDILVLAAAGQPVIEFLIRVVFIAAVCGYVGFLPGSTSVLIPLLLLPLVLMALGLGFFLSIANLAMRDIGNFIGVFMMFGMFLAPVLYPAPVSWPFNLVNVLNPVSPILIATQDLLSGGPLTHPALLAGSILFSFVVFIGGWKVFHFALPRVIERA